MAKTKINVLEYTDKSGIILENVEFIHYRHENRLLPGGFYPYRDMAMKVSLDPESGQLVHVRIDGLGKNAFKTCMKDDEFLRAVWDNAEKNVAPAIWQKYQSGEWDMPKKE